MTTTQQLRKIRAEHDVDKYLSYPGIIGVGIAYKRTKGKDTRVPCFLFRVLKKGKFEPDNQIPSEIGGVPTDVIQSTIPKLGLVQGPGPVKGTQGGTTSFNAPTPLYNGRLRYRPIFPGCSVGLADRDTGTLGFIAYHKGDIQANAVAGQQSHTPSGAVIVSNNHILAGGAGINWGHIPSIGEKIVQPGPLDYGRTPSDTIAELQNWASYSSKYKGPQDTGYQVVDAAVADIKDGVEYDERIYNPNTGESNYLKGTADPELGISVTKLGRTTGWTEGVIVEIDTTCLTNFGNGIGFFREVFVVQTTTPAATAFSEPGDSGSSIITDDMKLVGLLFAGSDTFDVDQGRQEKNTICCQASYILEMFNLYITNTDAPDEPPLEDDEIVDVGNDIGSATKSIHCFIEKESVAGASSNTPVLITQEGIPDEFWNAVVNEDCSDIIATDSTGQNRYYREIVHGSKTDKVLEMWIKLPQVYSTQDTTFKLACGDALGTATLDYTKTWSDCYKKNGDFVAVYHFNNKNDANPRLDSSRSTNRNDLVINYPSAPTLPYNNAKTTGPFGSAFILNGERYFYAPDRDYLTPADDLDSPLLEDSHWVYTEDVPFSVVALVRLDGSPTAGNVIVAKGQWDEYYLSISNGRPVFGIFDKDRSTIRKYGSPLTQGTWYLLVATYDPTAPGEDGISIYVNGVDDTLASSSIYPDDYLSIDNSTGPLYVGKAQDDTLADITIAELWIMRDGAITQVQAANLYTNMISGAYNTYVQISGAVDAELPAPLSGFAPIINTPLSAQTVPSGTNVTWTIGVTGTEPLTYQWRKNHLPILGAPNAASYTISGVSDSDEGWYTVVVGNAWGFTSSAAHLLVDDIPAEDEDPAAPSGTAPTISVQPTGWIAPISGTATFSVTATGTAPLHYIWHQNGSWIQYTDNPTHTVFNVQNSSSGYYGCAVSNDYGAVVSAGAWLQVVGGAADPADHVPPDSGDAPDFEDAPTNSGQDPWEPIDRVYDDNPRQGSYIKVFDSAVTYKNYCSRALGSNGQSCSMKGCIRLNDGTLYAAFYREYARWVIYKSEDDGFSWNLVDRVTNVDRKSIPEGHPLFLLHSYVDDEQYVVVEDTVAGGGYTWQVYDFTEEVYKRPYGEVQVWDSNTYTHKVKGGLFSVCGDPDSRSLLFYSEASSSRLVAVEFDPTLAETAMIQSMVTNYSNTYTSMIDSVSKDEYAYVAAVDTNGYLVVLKYRKGRGTTLGYFESISTIQDNAHTIRDLAIAIDGKDVLMLAYSIESNGELVNVLAKSSVPATTIGSSSADSQWVKYDYNKPYAASTFSDPVNGTLTCRTRLIGSVEGGFMLGGVWVDQNDISQVYVRYIDGTTGDYSVGPAVRMNSKGGPINGCEFFRPSDEKLFYFNNLGGLRMAYLRGEGNDEHNADTLQTSIFQEKLANKAYPIRLQTDVTNYRIDPVTPGALRLRFNIFGAANILEDYYANGVTGKQTEQYIDAFAKIGIPMRILRYTPFEVATSTGRSAYTAAQEYTSRVIIDPKTYNFPQVAKNDEDFERFIERDIRKVFFPPDFYMDRYFVLNDGGYLKRTIWTLMHMGNEYEISQIVPRFIEEQICFYEANVYVIGPSYDPFKKITLPSET